MLKHIYSLIVSATRKIFWNFYIFLNFIFQICLSTVILQNLIFSQNLKINNFNIVSYKGYSIIPNIYSFTESLSDLIGV